MLNGTGKRTRGKKVLSFNFLWISREIHFVPQGKLPQKTSQNLTQILLKFTEQDGDV